MKISFEDYPDIKQFLRMRNSMGSGSYLAGGYGLIFEGGPRSKRFFRRVGRDATTGIPWFFHEVPRFKEFLKANYPEFFI